MSSRSSLLKRAIVPLLAVAAATTLCGPTRAATASWDLCQADPDTPWGIVEQVKCSMTGPSYWQTAVYHNDRLGGGGPAPYTNNSVNLSGQGDFYDPSVGHYYRFDMTSGGTYSGTYNCYCICSGIYYGGPDSGKAWQASTGGNRTVTR